MLDTSGRIATWNAGAQRLKLYEADEIIGQHFSRFYPAADMPRGNRIELERAIIDGRVEEEGWRVRAYLDADSTAETSVTERQNRPRNLRILLVEDQDDTRRILARLLTHFGHHTSVAVGVSDALNMFQTQPFDLLLSDIGLPDGTGYDVISEIKRTKDVKAIALTGFWAGRRRASKQRS
ncbi:MAG: response regulator [Verrucomicrobiota bacterium]|nr:response regulator [Verrucomicrobiota bacterium]